MKRERSDKMLTVYDRLDFGKYKGRTVKEVMEIEPGYLNWAERQSYIRLLPTILEQDIRNEFTRKEKDPDKNGSS